MATKDPSRDYQKICRTSRRHVTQTEPAQPLASVRQERFCELVAAGRSVTRAYMEAYAGENENAAAANGNRLMRNDKVSARIAHLSQAIADKALSAAAVTAERTLTECARIAFANMADYITIGDDGLPRLDCRNLTKDQSAALAEVTVETIKRRGRKGEEALPPVSRVKIKLHPKMPALEFMGKYLGLFSEQPAKEDPEAEARRAAGVKVLVALLDRKARGTLDAGMEAILNELTGFVPPRSG